MWADQVDRLKVIDGTLPLSSSNPPFPFMGCRAPAGRTLRTHTIITVCLAVLIPFPLLRSSLIFHLPKRAYPIPVLFSCFFTQYLIHPS